MRGMIAERLRHLTSYSARHLQRILVLSFVSSTNIRDSVSTGRVSQKIVSMTLNYVQGYILNRYKFFWLIGIQHSKVFLLSKVKYLVLPTSHYHCNKFSDKF